MKYFDEIQKLPSWIYILIASSLFTVLILIISQYSKATSSTEKDELILALVFVLITEAIVIFLIMSMKQETRIDSKGIYYRYPPLKIKEVLLPISKIKNYDSINYTSMQYGYKVGFFKAFVKTPSITMIGISKAIKLTFTDGSNFIIGTKNPDDFIQTLNKVKNRNNEIN